MTARLNPYLSFRDTAREAIEFYRSVFGGELAISAFGDMMPGDESEAEKVMHAQLETTSGFVLMASDTPNSMDYTPGTNFSVSLSGAAEDEGELRGYWDKLVEGGTVDQPLVAAPWGDSFGMCTDRFGVKWLVNIAGAPAESAPAS